MASLNFENQEKDNTKLLQYKYQVLYFNIGDITKLIFLIVTSQENYIATTYYDKIITNFRSA